MQVRGAQSIPCNLSFLDSERGRCGFYRKVQTNIPTQRDLENYLQDDCELIKAPPPGFDQSRVVWLCQG